MSKKMCIFAADYRQSFRPRQESITNNNRFMKQSHFLPLLLFAALLSSCTTYQYTARQTDINRRPFESSEQRAAIKVNYDKRVTATSEYQKTRRDAIAEAEFLCIQKENIDVVVDPIYKIEFNAFKFGKQYRATIIGYAGKYEEKATLLEQSTKYSIEDVEKYKLLYDPAFLPYYYQKFQPAGGDTYNYYIKSGAINAAPIGAATPAPAKSVMLKGNNKPAKPLKVMTPEEMYKAKKLRNAGIGMFVGGVVGCLGVGLPMLFAADDEMVRIAGGLTFIGVGAGVGAAGLITLSVGAARYNKGKKAQQQSELSLNAGSNGIGIGFTF